MRFLRPRAGARKPPHHDLVDEIHSAVEPEVDYISQGARNLLADLGERATRSPT